MGVPLPFAALFLSTIAQDLLRKKNKTPLTDEKPSTSASRGEYVPVLVGRRRIGAHLAWVSQPVSHNESNAGGKGTTGNGSQQLVYNADAHHVLCVGPGHALHKIWSNGKIIYEPTGGINPQTHPSGSSVVVPNFGTFIIYWGEADSPVDTYLADPTRIGVASRWKFCMRIVWIQARLGGFPTWPSIEYEPEVRPYKPGNLVGVSWDSLPERLSGSSGWLNNEPGPDPSSIFGIIDGFSQFEAGQSSTMGVLKIAGDHTAVFPTGGMARVVSQPYAPFIAGLVNISSSAYSSGETYYTPNVYQNVVSFNQDLTNATWVKTNVTVTTTTAMNPPFGTVGADQDRYQIANSIAFPNTAVWNAGHTSDADHKLSRFRNKITFWIYRFGQGGVNNLKISFIPFTTGPLVEHVHSVLMTFSGGQVVFSQLTNNCKIVENKSVLDANWRRFEVTYVAGHGATPSTSAYDTQVSFDTSGNSGNVVLAGVHWARDNGDSHTGITTIDFVEALTGTDDSVGAIQAYLDGFGPGGPNAAHVLDQLLFETFPHGAGLDRSVFDISSLEDVGTFLQDTDGLRTNVILSDGKEFEQAIVSIFADVGLLCAWDRISGSFIFSLIRNPSLLGVLPNVPEELVSAPLPERTAVREAKTADKGIFGFSDVALEYRDNIVIADDDGRAGIDQNQKGSVTTLETVIDTTSAIKVSERRAQEILVPVSKAGLTVLRDAGDFYPGQAINVFGFDTVQRVMEVQVDPKTRTVVHQIVEDSYSLEGATTILAVNWLPPDPVLPEPDLSVHLIELPTELLRGATRAVAALRIRANKAADTGAVWISGNDLNYKYISSNSRYVTGGTLLEDIADGTTDISTGPVIYGLGPDMAELAQSLTAADWALGRQLWICGDEIGFLQDVVPLGENYYRLDGLTREEYSTLHAAHATGETIYIVDPIRLTALYDPLIQDLQDVYVKAQPVSYTKPVALARIAPAVRTISVAGPTNPVFKPAEAPTGAIDGVNAVFTLSFVPNPPLSLMLFKNGGYMTQGIDYTLSGNTITFLSGAIPRTGSTLTAGLYQTA